MPSIIIEISETDHKQLREEYEQAAVNSAKSGAGLPVPRFEQWAGRRLVARQEASAQETTAEDTAAALQQTYQQLLERTMAALEHLGEERAIGRAEGAIAILVGMKAMEREAAQKKTIAFKARIRNAKKAM